MYEINTPDRISHFVAQITKESGYGKSVIEDGGSNPTEYFSKKKYGEKYRGVGYMQMTWKYNYEALATSLILAEHKDLNDEFRFLNPASNGVDAINSNYIKLVDSAISKGYDIKESTDIVDKGSVYVSQNYAWATAGFWWDNNGMNELIDSGADSYAVTAVVNENTDTYEERYKLYQKVVDILK